MADAGGGPVNSLWELNVYGFTDQAPDLPAEIAGTFRGCVSGSGKVIFKN